MHEISEDLAFSALLGVPTTKKIYPTCLSCGGSVYVYGESIARCIAARKGLCVHCSKQRKEFVREERLIAATSIKRDKAFYFSLAVTARQAARHRDKLLLSAQKQDRYVLWRARRWLGRVLKEICSAKQSQENEATYLLENSDPLGLRECYKCGELKFLRDFPMGAKGLYTSKVCSDCRHVRKLAEGVRERARARRRRADRPIDITSLVLPLTDVERKLANRRSKKASKKRQRADPIHRIHRNFSEVVRKHIKKFKQKKPVGGWQSVVGYTVNDLKEHLESKFVDGMSWDNYGEWHIDHIVPKSAFTVEHYGDPHFLACWDLSNLQPLWAEDNVNKSNSLVWSPSAL